MFFKLGACRKWSSLSWGITWTTQGRLQRIKIIIEGEQPIQDHVEGLRLFLGLTQYHHYLFGIMST